MGSTADMLRTNAGVTNEWLHSIEHAQYQNSGTSSPNNLMGFMMDILSCQSRKSTGEINDMNDGCFNLGELVPELWCMLTHSPGLL